jgi:hypothetical protein
LFVDFLPKLLTAKLAKTAQRLQRKTATVNSGPRGRLFAGQVETFYCCRSAGIGTGILKLVAATPIPFWQPFGGNVHAV